MSPTLTTFLFEAINFLTLAGVMAWLFFTPVRTALKDYRDRLDELSRTADGKLAAAEQTRSEANALKSKLQDELATLRADAIKAAQGEADALLAKAREEAARLKEAGERHVSHLEKSQAAAMARAIAVAAGKVVNRLLADLKVPDFETSLVEAACQQLSQLNLDDRQITIESATPLSESQQQRISELIQRAGTTANYRIVPELLGGIRITTTGGLIDASVEGLAEFARQALSAELVRRSTPGAVNGK